MSLDLKDPNLLGYIKTEYLDRKITGEDRNKQTLFLVCCSAFTKNPLSAIVKGPSGAGKSHLVNRVLDIFRRLGCVIEFSRITGAYLENMAKHQEPIPRPTKPDRRDFTTKGELDKEAYKAALKIYFEKLEEYKSEARKPRRLDLTGKILFIDELRGIQNAQAPKLLISEGRLRLGTVINGEPVEIEVTGTPVIITTTTLAVLEDPEFENRVIPIQIDETEQQTERVLEFEASVYGDPAEDLSEYARNETLTKFFQELKPWPVANPYAWQLAKDYPKKNLEARRDYRKLMSMSNVVTWLYQHQRQRAKKGLDLFLVAELPDIETVRDLALSSLRESLTGISDKDQAILDYAKEQMDGLDYRWLPVKEFFKATKKQTRRGEEWTRQRVKHQVAEGYMEEQEVKGKQWRFEYRFSDEPPETLEINTDLLSSQIVNEWAEARGYILVLGLEGPQIQAKPTAFDKSEPNSFPKESFGNQSIPNLEFGKVSLGNDRPSKPKPSVGIECPRCHISYPDKPSYDNHLSSYKHD